MAYIFQQLADKGKAAGVDSSSIDSARDWYREEAKKVTSVNTKRMMRDKANVVGSIDYSSIGKMYMFFYDPKHKDTLPYYDTFPLVFPIGFQTGGFLGLNMHYLPTYRRASLLNALYTTLNNNKYDSTTKLNISYEMLNSAARFSDFKVCVKKYLYDHVMGGQYLYVDVVNWDKALMLPTERFVNATKQQVHKNSTRNL
jgi:hypothetical protein